MEFNPEHPINLSLLPPSEGLNNSRYGDVLLKARVELAELKGYSFSMPNPMLLLSPAILRESIASSEIENIHTTIVDVLQNQLFPEKEQRKTDKEVLRYRDAVLWGFEHLKQFPISTRIILGVHNKLIPSQHGEYRKHQNAIADQKTKKRIYTPPIARDLPRLIGNWENFINNKDDGIDPLIKAAVCHYQFEAIHPFDDGNGRTGRILMVLYLISEGVLEWPILYISGYLIKNRSDYYKLLNNITKTGNWDEFIIFMLRAFHSQAKETRLLLLRIMDMYAKFRKKIKSEHKKIYSADLAEALFSYPIITPVKLGKLMGVHYATASRHLTQLAKAGILDEDMFGKYHLFINKDLLKVMQGE